MATTLIGHRAAEEGSVALSQKREEHVHSATFAAIAYHHETIQPSAVPLNLYLREKHGTKETLFDLPTTKSAWRFYQSSGLIGEGKLSILVFRGNAEKNPCRMVAHNRTATAAAAPAPAGPYRHHLCIYVPLKKICPIDVPLTVHRAVVPHFLQAVLEPQVRAGRQDPAPRASGLVDEHG